jgi:hypothetical protein
LGRNPDIYFLRCRIRARIRRFLRPIFLRPRPVFFTPTKSTPVEKVQMEFV